MVNRYKVTFLSAESRSDFEIGINPQLLVLTVSMRKTEYLDPKIWQCVGLSLSNVAVSRLLVNYLPFGDSD